jgi:hypothetical protein
MAQPPHPGAGENQRQTESGVFYFGETQDLVEHGAVSI